MWVDRVSLGKVARSTRRTLWPFLARCIAVEDPAHLAPTITASYIVSPLFFALLGTIVKFFQVTNSQFGCWRLGHSGLTMKLTCTGRPMSRESREADMRPVPSAAFG